MALPHQADYARHVYHLYVIRSGRRDDLQRHLAQEGIGSLIHYPVPVHLQEAYSDLGLARGALPETERAAEEILSLPLYPELPDEAIAQVAAVGEPLQRLIPAPQYSERQLANG